MTNATLKMPCVAATATILQDAVCGESGSSHRSAPALLHFSSVTKLAHDSFYLSKSFQSEEPQHALLRRWRMQHRYASILPLGRVGMAAHVLVQFGLY